MKFNKFDRTDFMDKILVDGKQELDIVTNSLNDFKLKRQITYYRVTQEDVQRPDLIAIKAYNDFKMMEVWWIIMKLNNIHDIWNDIIIGDLLIIPSRQDLEDFFVFNRNN